MAEIRNLTPHTISIVDDSGAVVKAFAPDEVSARVASASQVVDHIDGIDVEVTTFGEVEGLPEEKEGVYYIVSRLVMSACGDRHDLLAPGQQVRDDAGRVIGCKTLSR